MRPHAKCILMTLQNRSSITARKVTAVGEVISTVRSTRPTLQRRYRLAGGIAQRSLYAKKMTKQETVTKLERLKGEETSPETALRFSFNEKYE